MDEPTRDEQQTSDDALFDAAVAQGGDTQSAVETDTPEATIPDEMEVTTPESAPAESSTGEMPPANDSPAPAEVTAPDVKEEVTPEAAPVAPSPAVAPVEAEPARIAEAPKAHNSGGILVLQWLSYAFWGWFGTSLTVLAGITIGFFMGGKAADFLGGTLAYPLAAVIVMLLISMATDFFYAHHEPAVKTGAANVIMLIHTVLDLLIAVGALITIVFAGISMLLADTNSYSSGTNGEKIAMLTALVVLLVFGSLSVRMLFGGKKTHVRKLFWLLMTVLAFLVILGGVLGPAVQLAATKDDRLIEESLPTLANSIDDYAQTNNRLPVSLSDVKIVSYGFASAGNVQQLISKHLVTYKPNTKADTGARASSSTTSTTTKTQSQPVSVSPVMPNRFYYQLCVTYTHEKKPTYYTANPYGDQPYASSTINTDSHPKGEKCYSLVASGDYAY